MSKTLAGAIAGGLIAAMFAIALGAISALPAGAQIAVHWGADWQPNAYLGKWLGLLFNPMLAILFWKVMSVSQSMPAPPGKLPMSAEGQRALWVCVLVILLAVELFVATSAFKVGGTL